MKSRRIIVEYSKRYLSKYILCFLNGQVQHLFAIAFASQIVINDDESKANDSLRRIRIAKHDMPHDISIIVDGSIREDII